MVSYKPSISIFFPFLNDWGTVGSLIGLAIATVEKLTDDWELIIVNDGSSPQDREALEMIVETFGEIDRQFKIYHSYSSLHSDEHRRKKSIRMVYTDANSGKRSIGRIKIIDHEKNMGYGGALRTGFKEAKKELIFYTDCDAQYDPRELTGLYEAMKPFDEIGMVNGYKIKRSDPMHRVIAGRIYHHLVKLAFNLPIRDTDCDFRLIRREVFDKVLLFENTGTICVELVKKIDHHGYKITEIPVHHYFRTSGRSQFFNFKRLFFTGLNLFKLWWKLMVKKEYEK